MSTKAKASSRLFITPVNAPPVREVVEALKQQPGLWEQLCRASLWQWPTLAGEPVHDEQSALCAILNQLGHWEAGCAELADAFYSTAGAERIQALLTHAGIAEFDRDAWLYWMRRIGTPVSPEDCPPAEKFSDGWHLRIMRRWAGHEPRGDAPPPGARSTYNPAEIPPTGEDENVLWCFDDQTGRVYPLVY